VGALPGSGEYSTMMRNKDVLTGAFFVVLGIVIYVLTYDIKDFVTTSAGAAFLPTVCAVLFVVLGAVLVLEGRRTVLATSANVPDRADPSSTGPASNGLRAVVLTVALMAAYIGLLDSIGFVITTILYIFCQTLILARGRKSNYLMFAAVAVAMSIATYVVFVRIFQVMIPSGLLG
jgi:putative tricarboxylic transport membrane protein